MWAGVIVFAAMCAAIGYWLGGMRDRAGAGVLLGALFGPLGLILVLLMPDGASTYANPTPDDSTSRTTESSPEEPRQKGHFELRNGRWTFVSDD